MPEMKKMFFLRCRGTGIVFWTGSGSRIPQPGTAAHVDTDLESFLVACGCFAGAASDRRHLLIPEFG